MSRWIWILAAIAISTLVYFTIRFGLSPKPVPMMSLTQFTSSEDLGATVYKRLRQFVRQERVLVLGSSPELNEGLEVWSGFMKSALADKMKVDVFFQRRNLPAIPKVGEWELVEFDPSDVLSGKTIEEIKARLQRGHLVLVHTSTIEGTHFVKDSLTRKLDQHLRQPVLSISTFPLVLTPQGESDLQALCLNARDEEGVFKLSCAADRAAKKALRRKPDPSKMWALLERHGLKEYLLFIHR